VKIIGRALNVARRQGLIPTNPAEAVELPEIESTERGTFNLAEVKMLMNAAEGVALSRICGLPKGECVS